VGAFGTMTCFWDWICGTDKAYRQFAAKEREEKQGRKGEEVVKGGMEEELELETKKGVDGEKVLEKKAVMMHAQ